jgi:mono/diheme cytochrome c family protein
MKSVKKHSQIERLVIASLTFLFLFTFNLSAQGDTKAGKSLFNANCAACHKLDKKLVGPALGKISERRELEWLKAWIKDNNALRASGDADAIAIYEEYNGAPMNAFPQLSDIDIVNIVSYLDADPVKKAGVASVAPVQDEVKESGTSNIVSYVVILILAGLIVFVYFKSNNGFLKILATIILLFNIAYFGFTALLSIGVDQGYQPVQPIAFSHRIHAGDNKIDCQYCHSSAKNSKSSGIPSVNVCMNCHKNISEVSEETATAEHSKAFYDGEIQKLYKAAGWDSEFLEYTGETEPIVWTRIHNLPDFAYYNHAQHVTVGGIKCQKCHGPVEEMEELYQYSPLTMGWCIDCHKETKVKMEGNGYYKNIHDDLSKKFGVEKVTVAQMGGKECGKCHY